MEKNRQRSSQDAYIPQWENGQFLINIDKGGPKGISCLAQNQIVLLSEKLFPIIVRMLHGHSCR